MRVFKWIRSLFRRKQPDDRWWEDGHPVVVKTFTSWFQAVMAREFCKAEWEMTLDLHRQLWGDPYNPEQKEIKGLADFT